MSVYVDPLRTIIPKDARTRRAGTIWCHMWADTEDELHAMARRIGMKRAWFQDDIRLPHYDLVPSRRAKAIALGAVEVGIQELAAAIRKKRQVAS